MFVNLPTCNLTCHEIPACFRLFEGIFSPCYLFLVYYSVDAFEKAILFLFLPLSIVYKRKTKTLSILENNLVLLAPSLAFKNVCSCNVLFHSG